MTAAILVVDQGTTSTRAILYDERAAPLASAQKEFRQIYPHPGWIEHDPADLWETTRETMREVLASGALRERKLAAFGLTNQRETTLVWSRADGEPIHNAIVWQDRRTAAHCARLKAEGHEPMIRARTGLLLDPYFSATKIAWILDHVPGARARARPGSKAGATPWPARCCGLRPEDRARRAPASPAQDFAPRAALHDRRARRPAVH